MKLRKLTIQDQRPNPTWLDITLRLTATELEAISHNAKAVQEPEGVFAEALSLTRKVEANVEAGRNPVAGLPHFVEFPTNAEHSLTLDDVEAALAAVIKLANPSPEFAEKVLKAVYEHFDLTGYGIIEGNRRGG